MCILYPISLRAIKALLAIRLSIIIIVFLLLVLKVFDFLKKDEFRAKKDLEIKTKVKEKSFEHYLLIRCLFSHL